MTRRFVLRKQTYPPLWTWHTRTPPRGETEYPAWRPIGLCTRVPLTSNVKGYLVFRGNAKIAEREVRARIRTSLDAIGAEPSKQLRSSDDAEGEFPRRAAFKA